MSIEVVEDYPHLLGLGVVLVGQTLHGMGEVHRCAPLGNIQMAPASFWLEESEDVDHPPAFVFVVLAHHSPRLCGHREVRFSATIW